METSHDSPQPDPSAGDPATPSDAPQVGPRRPLPGAAVVAAAAVGIIAALALVFVVTGGDEAPAQSDDALAAMAFLTTDGSTSTLADFRGEPLVVNFFASWCAPCRAELPDFEQVHLANDSVTFLGINHDLDEPTWRSFVDETEITYATVFQPETEIFDALGAAGMPSTALLSPEGEVLHLHTGLMTAETLQELIDEHLLEKT